MSKVVTADFTAPDAKTRNLIERMRRFDLHDRIELLTNNYGRIVFRTRFTLADQVLLHGLVSSQSSVTIVDARGPEKPEALLQSLIGITREVYGVELADSVAVDTELLIDSTVKLGAETGFAGKDALSGIVAVNPLADWSEAELVQYVLDHEVPVNPADMPGNVSRVA